MSCILWAMVFPSSSLGSRNHRIQSLDALLQMSDLAVKDGGAVWLIMSDEPGKGGTDSVVESEVRREFRLRAGVAGREGGVLGHDEAGGGESDARENPPSLIPKGWGRAVIEMNEVPHQIPLTVAKIGDDVTLTCTFLSEDAGLSYWYKLNFGYMLETVVIGAFGKLSLKGQFYNSRFSATKVGNVNSLTIRNISKEDEATYLCQAGSAYVMEFITGTVLVVNEKTQQKSVTVKQIPDLEMVPLGDTMTLQCSLLYKNKNNTECLSGNKVHWFRARSESYPDTIYHGSIRNTEEGKCVYSLSKSITTSSDAGTYYCAVVTCGEILFGEGTKVAIISGQKWDLVVIVLGMLLALCVIVIAILILSRD
ncbi:uncharacterized protein LOC115787114 [Archocentrus centrarchus]|uniref:uncharacterized protein LOC115787114 n=1 Tax=Archocentrus centrarchus TaxID=63155 RepID=UPI0011EA0001|nr:uncharacterized protein LOC115787114 [Archocentrus centrarchus]